MFGLDFQKPEAGLGIGIDLLRRRAATAFVLHRCKTPADTIWLFIAGDHGDSMALASCIGAVPCMAGDLPVWRLVSKGCLHCGDETLQQ